MTRLIDADAFKKENERLLHCDFPYLSETTLEELIDEAPTVDAVPVIRCKDCRHNSNKEGNFVDCAIIPQMFGKTADNNFCSYAEPKETT